MSCGDSGCESMISTGLLPCSPPRCTKVGNVQAACLMRSTELRRYSFMGRAHGLAHLILVGADEGVQHERHMAVARMARLCARPRGTT